MIKKCDELFAELVPHNYKVKDAIHVCNAAKQIVAGEVANLSRNEVDSLFDYIQKLYRNAKLWVKDNRGAFR